MESKETRTCILQCTMLGKDGKLEEFPVVREINELDHKNWSNVLRDAGIAP